MSRSIALPNFLVVGAAKSATTSLHFTFARHPEMFVPRGIKETFHLLSPQTVLGNGIGYKEKAVIEKWDNYIRLFQTAKAVSATAVGEVCNAYLYYYRESIPVIRQRLGNPKILIILRNPVERTYSAYLHLVREEIVNETLEECLAAEPHRIANNWWWAFHIAAISRYSEAVSAYRKAFTHVKIITYEELASNPAATLRQIYTFLEVDPNRAPIVSRRYNRTGKRVYPFGTRRFLDGLQKIERSIPTVAQLKITRRLSRFLPRNVEPKQPMHPETRKSLVDSFANSVHELGKVGVPISEHWNEWT